MTGDDDAFQQAMKGVTPLKPSQKADVKRTPTDSINLSARRESAQALPEKDKNFLSGEYIERVAPHDILSFKRDGVQHGVFKNLRLGKYAIDARLDLHRHTVEQARKAVFQFVQDCVEQEIRCALITHGKGDRGEEKALLKSCVNQWLPQFDQVLAFHSAQARHGGSGSCYLLLKKSERKRLENLERHQKRKT